MKNDFDNERPIHIQLKNNIKISIINGNYLPEEKLPSVRDLAIKYKVNPNTVQKALSDIEEEGLIYTERTNGKYVTKDIKKIEKVKSKIAKELTKKYIDEMKKIGISSKEINKTIREENK